MDGTDVMQERYDRERELESFDRLTSETPRRRSEPQYTDSYDWGVKDLDEHSPEL